MFRPSIGQSQTTAFRIIAVVFLLMFLLFADSTLGQCNNFIVLCVGAISDIVRDPSFQWLFLIFSILYLCALLCLRFQTSRTFCKLASAKLWLGCIFIDAVSCALNYSSSTQPLIFIFCPLFAQATALLAERELSRTSIKPGNSLNTMLLALLIVVTVAALIGNRNRLAPFHHYDLVRWSGPWNSPNIFGLLMGTGITLAVGYAVLSFKFQVSSGRMMWWTRLRFGLLVTAAGMVARGLLHSYSRGAWLATGCGLGYLAVQVFSFQFSVFNQWLRKNILTLAAVVFSMGSLAFWQFRQTDWHPARRAFSSVNVADFSWRNRVAAWEGALQITAEHRWFGASWNQPEALYENYYLPSKLSESAAIEMNDYLMLGATLGIPALLCFGMYIWLTLTGKTRIADRQDAHAASELDWLKTTCRAGAIVLLVGFWFDGGLFELPTAATFWILLELGSVVWSGPQPSNEGTKEMQVLT
jgi:O-antigen ligase